MATKRAAPRSAKRAAPAGAAWSSLELADFLIRNRELLVASVIGSGLADVRRRSAPDRLDREAHSFLTLFLKFLQDAAPASLAVTVRQEVCAGAFAGDTPEEARHTLVIWRRTLDGFLPALSKTRASKLVAATIARLEEPIEMALRRWERRRIDVIVLGASAGGVEALSSLMPQLGPDLPVTLIIVQHVGHDGPSVLPAILSRHSGIHIAPAVENAPLYLGYAYVAVPNRHLTVGGGRLRLMDAPPVHFAKPAIDVLFRSAAAAYGTRLASIILSGAGRDGADGTRAVHELGGLTIAQAPVGAAYGAMPEAAIATGAVDLVIPQGELASYIRRLALSGRPSEQMMKQYRAHAAS